MERALAAKSIVGDDINSMNEVDLLQNCESEGFM